jgi:CRISPR-associated protein Csx17
MKLTSQITTSAPAKPSETHYLSGCGLASLGDYLKALGILRKLPQAKGYWQNGDFYLQCPFDRSQLLDFLTGQMTFSPLLSPWNQGSFYWAGGLDDFSEEHFPGLGEIRTTYAEICSELGITKKGQIKKSKDKLLDAATKQIDNKEYQAWLDTVFCIQRGVDKKGQPTLKTRYSAMLGAGGIFNKKDVADLYLQSAQALIELGDEAKIRWESSLFGGAGAGADAGVSGLGYFPAAGLINDSKPCGLSPYSVAKGKWETFCSYVDLVLVVEGLLLLSSMTVRVLEASEGEIATYPLVVWSLRGTDPAIGQAEESKGIREAWLPLWDKPTTATQLKTNLMAALRAPMSRSAPDAYDFAQHVAANAHKHGVQRFVRCPFLPRYGKSHYAIMGDIFEPSLSKITLDPVRHWIQWASGLDPKRVPNGFVSLVRVASLKFGACVEGRGSNLDLLLALGAIERYIATSPGMRNHINNLPDLGKDWIEAILAEQKVVSGELEIALALASLQAPTLRHFWRAEKRGSEWTSKGCWKYELIESLIAVQHHARCDERQNDFAVRPRGKAIAPSLDALAAFVDGRCDDALISSYLWGVSLCELPSLTFEESELGAVQVDPLLRVITLEGECNDVVFRRLVAGDRRGAIQELQLRLGLKGERSPGLEYTEGQTRRIAAALLFPVSEAQLRQMRALRKMRG